VKHYKSKRFVSAAQQEEECLIYLSETWDLSVKLLYCSGWDTSFAWWVTKTTTYTGVYWVCASVCVRGGHGNKSLHFLTAAKMQRNKQSCSKSPAEDWHCVCTYMCVSINMPTKTVSVCIPWVGGLVSMSCRVLIKAVGLQRHNEGPMTTKQEMIFQQFAQNTLMVAGTHFDVSCNTHWF